MSVSNQVRALLNLTGRKQVELQDILEMGSKQSLNNKFAKDRWSAEDLIRVSEFCGCKLAFILPSGERITLSGSPATTPPSGDMPGPGAG